MTVSTDPLLQPFALKDLTLRNRVVSTSHEPAYSEGGLPKDRYTAYHVEKAKGGVALTMIGGSAVVAPDSPPAFGNLEVYRDEIVPRFRRLTDAVHEHGSYVMCQITHLGRRTSNYSGDWLPVIAPSPIKERAHRANPKQAEAWDIERIVADYASAAQRCVAGGLDGVEIEAYGHLFDGFLSPATNRRDDEWGGSFENRMRFPLQVVQAVRAAVGPSLPIGLRIAITDDLRGGLATDEGLAAARLLIAAGIDFLSVIRGHIDTDQGLLHVIPPMGMPSAPHLDFAGEVRAALDVPVMHASRIADVATARHAVRNGLVDLVGMTRAQIADPHLVAKIKAGEEHRIRPCVGASYCLDAIYQDGATKCIHNPSTGRELSLPHTVAGAAGPSRRALVIGAGPAGLEAARVLGERGHDVTVLEAAEGPGGQVRLAARAPLRRDLIGIIDWRVSECERAGVKILYNVYADERAVPEYQPGIVVVATGGFPDASSFGDLCTDAWDILSGTVRPRGTVLLYDDNGGHAGLDAARTLLDAGVPLDYVTPERVFGPDIGEGNYPLYAKAFGASDTARITLLHTLQSVTRRADGRLSAVLYSEHADRTVEHIVDQVVIEQGTVANDQLYHALVPGSSNLGEVDMQALLALQPQAARRNEHGAYQIFRIGDAVSSRNIHAAVLDAYRLCSAV